MTRPARGGHKSAVLVLGPHRSGTSLVARILNLLGYDLGRDLLGQHECNVTGLWENAALVAWDDAYLSGIGSSWFDHRLLQTRPDSDGFDAAVQELAAVLQDQFGEADRIAIKDPRICRLVPLYEKALRILGYEVRALVQYRLPSKTALSLYRRDGLPLAAGLRLWLSHMLQLLEDTQGWDRLFVGYADLLQSPDAEVGRIASWTSGSDAPFSVSPAANIADFVDPRLESVKNSAVDPAQLESGVDALVVELYAALCRARDNAHEPLLPLLEHWLDRYHDLATDACWLDRLLVTIVHADAPVAPECVSYLQGILQDKSGLLIMKDGEGLDAAGGEWAQRTISSGIGLMYNRVERGESQSLVRGIGLCRGHDVLILRCVAYPLAGDIFQVLEGKVLKAGGVVLFVDKVLSGQAGLDANGIPPEACIALYAATDFVGGLDPWLCINPDGDAMTQLIALLASHGTKITCCAVEANTA